ncbi:MAG TPA: hypothetical protein VD735_04665, partial [Candidatus Saccharimonadales bacterium]|nr:hypothetical protein [Candidatus Saccharimonadales bacterium]
ASKPKGVGNASFVTRTMQAVLQAQGRQDFETTLAASVTPQKESLFTRFKHLPKVAMVAIITGSLVILSGSAYAALRWLEPHINILGFTAQNEDAKRQYTVAVKDCGIVRNDPPFGTVTAITPTTITIAATTYQGFEQPDSIAPGTPVGDYEQFYKYYPQGKTLTHVLPFAKNAEALHNGKPIALSDLKVNDTVYFESTNTRIVQADGTWGKQTDIQAAHIIKTDIRPQYVMNIGVGNPAYVGGTNRLTTCQGNDGYLCVSGKPTDWLHYRTLYAYTPTNESPLQQDTRFTGNERHFRTDLNPNSEQGAKAYRTIEGRVSAVSGNKITFKARGKQAAITVTLPPTAFATAQTKKDKPQQGDFIVLGYMQTDDEDHTAIQSRDLMTMQLLERRRADGSLKKY